MREGLRLRLAGGRTVLQVLEALDPEVRSALGDGPDPVAARVAADRVQRALGALVAAGRVRRERATLGARLGNKGPRKVVVDLFRVA